MGKVLEIGKLDSDVLRRIVFDKIKYKRDEIITGPRIGEDCASIDFGEYECVVSTDPITASVNDIGKLAIHISCNDVASNGVQPLGILLTILLPVGTTEEDVECIMEDAANAAEKCKVEIMGGHTEVTPAIVQPVIISTAVGRAVKGKVANTAETKPGDAIYMTKTAGLEGTGIIANDFAEELLPVIGETGLSEARALLADVSVVAEGIIGGEIGVSGMHDITEGGVLGAVWEMCNLSGNGCRLYDATIPIPEITAKICAHYGIECRRLISSGCMLMTVPEEKTALLEEKAKAAGIMLTRIGEVTPGGEGIMLVKADGSAEPIDPPQADELYKVVGR